MKKRSNLYVSGMLQGTTWLLLLLSCGAPSESPSMEGGLGGDRAQLVFPEDVYHFPSTAKGLEVIDCAGWSIVSQEVTRQEGEIFSRGERGGQVSCPR